MKLTAFCLLVGFLQLSAKATAQQRLNISMESTTLEKVFAGIEKRSGYTVLYNVQVLKETDPLTLDIKDASIEDVMRQYLKWLPLEFNLQDKTIFVKKDIRKTSVNPIGDLPSATFFIPGWVARMAIGAPLSGATVDVLNLKKRPVTDEKGIFTLKNVPDGEYEVIIAFAGYENYRTKASAAANDRISFSKISTVEI